MRAFKVTVIVLISVYVVAAKSKSSKSKSEGDFCDKTDPGTEVEKFDKCLVNSTMKSKWTECQERVLGSSDPEDVAEAYCAKDTKGKKEIGKKLGKCLKESKLAWKDLGREWDKNCGFCTRKELAQKLDECIEEGKEKVALLSCRRSVFKTQDPMVAAVMYCDADKKEKKSLVVKTVACFGKAGVTKESWREATQNCDFDDDDEEYNQF